MAGSNYGDDKSTDPSYSERLSAASTDEVVGQETLQSSAKVEYSALYLKVRRKVDLRIMPLVLIQ